MAVSSKEDLLANAQLDAVELELPSGRVVEVRGVTQEELRQLQPKFDDDGMWLPLLSVGLVAPELTADELSAWMAVAPAGDPKTAAEKIWELSGLMEGAAKAAYKSVRRGSKS